MALMFVKIDIVLLVLLCEYFIWMTHVHGSLWFWSQKSNVSSCDEASSVGIRQRYSVACSNSNRMCFPWYIA